MDTGNPVGSLRIAVAASLKLTPLVFVLIYAGQREWGKVGMTLGLTALLVGPILLLDLPEQATMAGPSNSLIHVHPALWAAVAATAVGTAAWLAYRVSPARWLGACAAVVMASPRLIGYDLTVFLAATPFGSVRRESAARTDDQAWRAAKPVAADGAGRP